MKEYWEIAIPGYYEVSSYGNIRSLDRIVSHPQGPMLLRGKDMKLSLANTGYLQVEFRVNGKRETHRVHRLVAFLFIYNPDLEKFNQVNHIDGNKLNNRADNLEWCDASYNLKHAFQNNLMIAKKGEEKPNAILTAEEVQRIRFLYSTGDYTQHDLDKMFKVGAGTVNKIVRNLAWTHV